MEWQAGRAVLRQLGGRNHCVEQRDGKLRQRGANESVPPVGRVDSRHGRERAVQAQGRRRGQRACHAGATEGKQHEAGGALSVAVQRECDRRREEGGEEPVEAVGEEGSLASRHAGAGREDLEPWRGWWGEHARPRPRRRLGGKRLKGFAHRGRAAARAPRRPGCSVAPARPSRSRRGA